jgi:micrococcal nuclease
MISNRVFMKFLLLLLLCLPSLVNGDIYRWRDGNGGNHYSDRRHADAKRIDIKPGYSFYRVKTVYDGDTLVLEDGRKIRLLGINTPEVQHRNQMADAGGMEAKQWLIDKLKDIKIRLETDVEQQDKYGRILAHVFTEHNEHINQLLVEAGLAAVNIYPPNLLYAEPLLHAEQKAEDAKLGIWREKQYAAIPVEHLPEGGHPGWTRVQGRVTGIRSSRKFVYLKFTNRFEARIERKWLPLFTDFEKYPGQILEMRGWLNKYKKGYSMLIRHPSAVKRL